MRQGCLSFRCISSVVRPSAPLSVISGDEQGRRAGIGTMACLASCNHTRWTISPVFSSVRPGPIELSLERGLSRSHGFYRGNAVHFFPLSENCWPAMSMKPLAEFFWPWPGLLPFGIAATGGLCFRAFSTGDPDWARHHNRTDFLWCGLPFSARWISLCLGLSTFRLN